MSTISERSGMTGKAAFTEQEWKTILEGPPSAGVEVSPPEQAAIGEISTSLRATTA
jgi:hypothetical protein